MITLQALSLRFARRAIFDEITATVLQEDRIGLVGSNGAGKTTLLKVLAGVQELDSGKVSYGQQVRIGYLPQDGLLAHGRTLFDEVESAAVEILKIRAQQAALEATLNNLPEGSPKAEEERLILELSHLDDILIQLDAHLLPVEVETILLGLGFKSEDNARQTSEFSGGWQMRIALAKLLLAKPHLLLLDEPTNHLDLPSQCWLERFLETYPGAIMVVSHDQAFMDSLCTKIFEISRGDLSIYNGNYSEYEDQKVARTLILEAAHKTQQKKIDKTQAFIDRFGAKASKATQAQSRMKALEKMERIELKDEESKIGFRFPPARQTGQQVIKLEGMGYQFGAVPLFENLDICLERGDKVGIVGPNGAGKTTLLKILAGALPLQSGNRATGHQVELAYFAQHQAEELDPKKNVLDTVSDLLKGGDKINPRTVLGSLLFTAEDVFKPVKVLSGGEKNRLALAKILLQGANCLLLDEPTNHLDINSKRVLQKAIQDFQGSVIIVSHDRAFLDPIVSRIWEIREKKVQVFYGNVSAYVQSVEDKERAAAQAAKSQKTTAKVVFDPLPVLPPHAHAKAYRKAQIDSSAWIKKMEEAVQALEARRDAMEKDLADPSVFKNEPAKAHQLARDHTALVKELENQWEAWSRAQEEHALSFKE